MTLIFGELDTDNLDVKNVALLIQGSNKFDTCDLGDDMDGGELEDLKHYTGNEVVRSKLESEAQELVTLTHKRQELSSEGADCEASISPLWLDYAIDDENFHQYRYQEAILKYHMYERKGGH